jgi:catechol 2,3-dioxygenase-like lactoylglutathione lyase family enzyme
MSARFHSICPVLLVDDIVKTTEWYRDKLGFHFHRYWGEPPCFTIIHRDTVELFLQGPECGPAATIMNPNTSRNAGSWDAYIRVDNVAPMLEQCQANGVQITRGPEDMFYEMRELEILDVNGYKLCFGQDISK